MRNVGETFRDSSRLSKPTPRPGARLYNGLPTVMQNKCRKVPAAVQFRCLRSVTTSSRGEGQVARSHIQLTLLLLRTARGVKVVRFARVDLPAGVRKTSPEFRIHKVQDPRPRRAPTLLAAAASSTNTWNVSSLLKA